MLWDLQFHMTSGTPEISTTWQSDVFSRSRIHLREQLLTWRVLKDRPFPLPCIKGVVQLRIFLLLVLVAAGPKIRATVSRFPVCFQSTLVFTAERPDFHPSILWTGVAGPGPTLLEFSPFMEGKLARCFCIWKKYLVNDFLCVHLNVATTSETG